MNLFLLLQACYPELKPPLDSTLSDSQIVDSEDSACGGAGQASLYADGDGDGFGTGVAEERCLGTEGYAEQSGDCDDAVAAIYPGAAEVCGDNIDQNCDNQVDTDGTVWLYSDGDQDGYGAANGQMGCPTAGYSTNDDDCNDGDGGIHPGATEVCKDGIDQDCAVGGCRDLGQQEPDVYIHEDENLSIQVLAPGDLDGDGLDDMALTSIPFYCQPGARVQMLTSINRPYVDGGLVDSFGEFLVGQIPCGVGFTSTGTTHILVVSSGDESTVTNESPTTTFFGLSGTEPTAWGSLRSADLVQHTFGRTTRWLDDLNGDGLGELAVGSPYMTTGSLEGEGRIWLLDPTEIGTEMGGTYEDHALGIHGDRGNAYLGMDVASADVDGDGHFEVITVVSGYDAHSDGMGALMVFDLSSITTLAGVQLDTLDAESSYFNSVADSRFDSAMMVAGDLNGSGFPEVVVSFVGPTTGSNGLLISEDLALGRFEDLSVGRVIEGDGGANEAGSDAAILDYDGDGFEDLFYCIYPVTFSGIADVHGLYGPDLTDEVVFYGTAPTFGLSLERLGDMNADGRDDLGIGVSGWTEAYVTGHSPD